MADAGNMPQGENALQNTQASADSPATQTAVAAEPVHHRVHHSYVWLGTIRAVFAVVFILAVSMFSSIVSLIADGGTYVGIGIAFAIGSVAIGLIVIVAVVLLIHVLAYKHLYFTLTPQEFNLYSGVITKRHVHVPYDRIQSVDTRATLLQRIFGVRTLYIDTAGGASNKAIMVPYLTKQNAQFLTDELYARKRSMVKGAQNAQVPVAGQPAAGNVLDVGAQVWNEVGGVFAGTQTVAAAPAFEFGLSNKELFLAGLSNNTSFVLLFFALIGALSQVFGSVFEVFPDESDAIIESVAAQAGSAVFGFGAIVAAFAFFATLLVLWVLSALSSCISYGGFRARRQGDRIEVERGLLQHTFQSVGVARVQAVVIKQTFVRRLIGYCEVSLDKVDASVSSEDGTQKSSLNVAGVVVHPFCKLDKVSQVLEGLIPEYADTPAGMTKVAKPALRRALIRRGIWQGGGFWLALCVAAAQVVVNAAVAYDSATTVSAAVLSENAEILGFVNTVALVLYAVALLLFVIDVIGAVFWARESGFAYNRRFLKIVNSGLSREERRFPKQKIQFGFTRTNPLQRMAKTATICARTAAGVGGTAIELIDVDARDGAAWLDWLKPQSPR